MQPVHYLDHNATSVLRPEAQAAVDRVQSAPGNPSSIHRAGRSARAAVELARMEVAKLVGAHPEQVVFTSGGTEANALALGGAVEGAAAAGPPLKALCVSAIEHDSVLKTAAAIAEQNPGIRVVYIPVKKDGLIDVETLDRLLKEIGGPSLVAAMAANNETGVIQPIADVVRLVHAAGGLCLVDAVQACGRVAEDPAGFTADYLTLSAHKLGGPQGIGALVVKDGAPLRPQFVGGNQEKNRRAGTENVAGISGFGAAAKACRHDDVSAELRDRFEAGLRQRFPDVIIFGENVPRLANTSNFAIPDMAAETAIIALDLDGVMVSSGAACSSGKVKSSHVLQAMGVSADFARSALRVSLGWNSTQTDIEAVLASLAKLSARIRARMAA